MTNRMDETDAVLQQFARECEGTDAIAVEGSRTRWATGGELDSGTAEQRTPNSDVRIVRSPAGIVKYQPEEMTVQVRAGTTVAELNVALADRGQRSALPERGGTVGGAVAVGENHQFMTGRGSLRTSLLQIQYVSAEGKLVAGGGPTVKNVSGFDLPRLFVGSLGTLGLIGDVILRTNPLPAVSLWLSSSDVEPMKVKESVLRPGAILWDGTTTTVLLEGHGADVAASKAGLEMLGSFSEVSGPPALPNNRWSLTPAEAAQMQQRSGIDTGSYVAELGSGLVFAEIAQPSRKLEPGIAVLHTRMKMNFDPTGRLNPGRHPGVR